MLLRGGLVRGRPPGLRVWAAWGLGLVVQVIRFGVSV